MHVRSKIIAFDYVQCLLCAASCENLSLAHANSKTQISCAADQRICCCCFLFSIKYSTISLLQFQSIIHLNPEDRLSRDAAHIIMYTLLFIENSTSLNRAYRCLILSETPKTVCFLLLSFVVVVFSQTFQMIYCFMIKSSTIKAIVMMLIRLCNSVQQIVVCCLHRHSHFS